MKKISYLMSMAVALVMGFSSCSSDDNIVAGDDSTASVVEGLPALVSISLTQSDVHTRATEETNVSVSEGKINHARVLIFNKQNLLEENVKLTSSKETQVLITTGSKHIYAVANLNSYTDLDDAAIKGATEQALMEIILREAKFSDYIKENSFIMTTVDKSQAEIITEPASEGEIQNVGIKVGRAVAKVEVTDKSANSNSASKLGKVEVKSYKLLNNVNETYLLPRKDASNHLITPLYNKEKNNTNYYATTGDTPEFIFTGLETPSYTPENSSAVQLPTNITTVMIKGVFQPDNAYTYDLDGKKIKTEIESTELKSYWLAKNNETGVVLPVVYVSTSLGEDGKPEFLTEEGQKHLVKIYNEQYNTTNTNLEGTGFKLYRYDKGQCYYTVPLKDEKKSNIIDKLSICRNNLYKMNVTSISKIGSNNSIFNSKDEDGNIISNVEDNENDTVGTDDGEDVEKDPTPDPETPLDPEAPVSITVEVGVEEWSQVDQNVGL